MARVLVVDDDPLIVQAVAGLLIDEGHDVRTADNGVRALQLLRDWRADLVFMDLSMPVMDGWTCAAAIKQSARFAGIPVVLMSAAEPALQHSLSLHADGALPKPFDAEDVLGTVRDLVAA